MGHVADMLEELLPIQSYRIESGVLKKKRMRSNIFEQGDQQKSYERFVEKGFGTGLLSIVLNDTTIYVYVIACSGISVMGFQELLQELAEDNSKHIEWSNFKYHARKAAELRNPYRRTEPTEQLWLHFGLDVFWTLDLEIFHQLSLILQKERQNQK